MKHWGSIEKYTEAMKHNLEHFSEVMDKQLTTEIKAIVHELLFKLVQQFLSAIHKR